MAMPERELDQAKRHPDVVKNIIKKDGRKDAIPYSPSNPPPATEGGRVWYATCSTASGAGAKTATSSTGDFVLANGSMVRVKFTTSNTAANPTISIDGSTAKTIQPKSGTSGMANLIAAGEVIDLVYDGSNFVMTKGNAATTSFYGITKLNSSTNSTSTSEAATPSAVKDVADAKVDRAGDTMTGNLFVAKAGNAYVQAEDSNTGVKLNLDTGSSANHGIYSYGYYDGSSFHYSPGYMIYRNPSGHVIVNGTATNDLPLGEVLSAIPNNSDIDNYYLPGTYKVVDNISAATMTNLPTALGGVLYVRSSVGKAISASSTRKYLVQEFMTYSGLLYFRAGDSGSGTSVTWGNWYGYLTTSNLPLSAANGGTGATDAATALSNLGAAPAPTVITKNTTTTVSTVTAEYTVSGDGTVIVFAGVYSDTTSDYGTWEAEIYYDGALIMGEGTRFTTANTQKYGASTSVPVAVTNGKKIKITLVCTKKGTKNIFRRFLCFGCTVS